MQNVKRLFEYDPTGILLYVEETDEKNYFNIFVLSLVDKQQIIDYVKKNDSFKDDAFLKRVFSNSVTNEDQNKIANYLNIIFKLLKILHDKITTVKSVLNDYIQFSILDKYGGFWIPCDVICVKSIKDTLNDYNNGQILTFSSNNLNYINNEGYSNRILAVKKDNSISKKMIDMN